ncbi:hypothetical protein E4U42_005288 [Claviceps africana]|uniref:Uncharacterized protein n=1 Tax=Claviceps africana TaxID=83212 RepID=A0A8K0NM21_9HYPO|nr:hypothetical protein E4U42_005288 [Claviceps africana]
MPDVTRASPGADKTLEANPTPSQQLPSTASTSQKDTVMLDVPIEQASSPVPANVAPSPAPARTGTPAQGSRAPSLHPDAGFQMPSEAPAHGDPTRRYLNTKVTGVLLEGMKQLAKDQPQNPLRTLGEYLIQRSRELEGTT